MVADPSNVAHAHVMKIIFLLDCIGSVTNSIALAHVRRSFDLKVHVFTLIFIDALISTICCFLSTILDTIAFYKVKSFFENKPGV